MAKEREARGPGDTNAQIITTDGGRISRPQNLLSAISEIQQFYVIESKGQNIPAEFLTLERTIDFFKIGLKSGFHEGIALVLLFPLFHLYLFPFVFGNLDWLSHLLFGGIPYLPLIINTAMCSYISRYYVGNITRKGINALLTGRALSLLIKAFLVYVLYLLPLSVEHPGQYLAVCPALQVKGPGNIWWMDRDDPAADAARHEKLPADGAGGGVSLWLGLPA
jgi:hypothetical protein